MEKNKIKSVQVQNFVFTLSEEGIVSVAASSGIWYVGFAPGCFAHAFIYSLVFAEDKEMSEEDKNVLTTLVTSMYCTCNIIDGEFTDEVYKCIDKYTKRKSEDVDAASEEEQQKSEEDLEHVKKLTEIEEEVGKVE